MITKTSTSSITNTKLAVAVLAAFIAGGAAFAATPLMTQKVINEKTVSVVSCRQATDGIYAEQKLPTTIAKKSKVKTTTTFLKNSTDKNGNNQTYTCVGKIVDKKLKSTNQYKLTTSKAVASSPTCSDNGDGLNYNIRGSSNGQLESQGYFVPEAYTYSTGTFGNQWDYCDSGIGKMEYRTSSNWIAERHCSGPENNRYVHTQWYQCPFGCENGACKPNPATKCTDSDGGKNYFQQGTVIAVDYSGNVGSSTDNCSNVEPNVGKLGEFYCDSTDNHAHLEFHSCEYGCQNGACINGTSTTEHNVGTLYMQMRTNDAGFNKDKIVLAGETTFVGKLFLRTEGEPIKITNLKFDNEGRLNNSVRKICITNQPSASNTIACATPDYYDVNFPDIDYVVNGSTTLYVYALTNNMGNSQNQTANTHEKISLILTASSSIHAKGVNSGELLSPPNLNGIAEKGEIVFDRDLNNIYDEKLESVIFTKRFEISGTKINSINFVNQYGGFTVDNKIAGPGEYTLGILRISTDAHNNTDQNGNPLKLQLSSLAFNVDKSSSLNLGPITMQKVGGLNGAISLNYSEADGKITADNLSASLTEDSKFESGAYAYYVIKMQLTPTDNGDTPEWIKLSMKNLDGYSDLANNIVWYDGFSNQNFYYLRLDTTQISGQRISE